MGYRVGIADFFRIRGNPQIQHIPGLRIKSPLIGCQLLSPDFHQLPVAQVSLAYLDHKKASLLRHGIEKTSLDHTSACQQKMIGILQGTGPHIRQGPAVQYGQRRLGFFIFLRFLFLRKIRFLHHPRIKKIAADIRKILCSRVGSRLHVFQPLDILPGFLYIQLNTLAVQFFHFQFQTGHGHIKRNQRIPFFYDIALLHKNLFHRLVFGRIDILGNI